MSSYFYSFEKRTQSAKILKKMTTKLFKNLVSRKIFFYCSEQKISSQEGVTFSKLNPRGVYNMRRRDRFFSDISERNNDYFDTLHFRGG